jgi:peroxiredoxin
MSFQCHLQHATAYIEKFKEFSKYKIDTVACTCVNDVFVVGAWAKSLNAGPEMTFLADGSGFFAKSLGLVLDLSAKNMGIRNERFALVAEDGVVKHIGIGGLEVSGAEAILAALETGI